MDTLSHGLWALAIFWGTSFRWWAFLVGMLPDLLSFGPFFVQRIFTDGIHMTRPTALTTPAYVTSLYNVTHSLFTWAIVALLLYVFWRKYWPIVGAAVAHIVLDIPTHNSYFPTPFLWPFSSYRYHGISWGTPAVFFTNWAALTVIFGLIWYYEKSKRNVASSSTRIPAPPQKKPLKARAVKQHSRKK